MDRDTIFEQAKARKAKGPEYVEIPLPEIGEVWHTRMLTIPEDHHLNERMDEFIKEGKANAWFACCAVFDPKTGQRIFGDLDVDNLVELFDAPVIRRVWMVGGKVNGLRAEDEEDRRKNSEKGDSGASS